MPEDSFIVQGIVEKAGPIEVDSYRDTDAEADDALLWLRVGAFLQPMS